MTPNDDTIISWGTWGNDSRRLKVVEAENIQLKARVAELEQHEAISITENQRLQEKAIHLDSQYSSLLQVKNAIQAKLTHLESALKEAKVALDLAYDDLTGADSDNSTLVGSALATINKALGEK